MINKIILTSLFFLCLVSTVSAQEIQAGGSIAPPANIEAPSQELLNQINEAAERVVAGTETEEDRNLLEENEVEIMQKQKNGETKKQKSSSAIWIILLINLILSMFLLYLYLKLLNTQMSVKQISEKEF